MEAHPRWGPRFTPLAAHPRTPPHSLCTTGISGKSQVLFAVVFTARYLDLFTNYISLYNTCMKVKLCLAVLRGECGSQASGFEGGGDRVPDSQN